MNDLAETTEDIECGMVDVDYSILCYNCNKLLREIDGTDVEDIYDDEKGEDICHECYVGYVRQPQINPGVSRRRSDDR